MDFTVHVATERFSHLRVERPYLPSLNSVKYGDLLDSLVDPSRTQGRHLDVHLVPWSPYMARTKLGRLIRILWRRTRTQGTYRKGVLRVAIIGIEEEDNSILLHETKHWAQDMLGDLPSRGKMVRVRLRKMAPYLLLVLVAYIITMFAVTEVLKSMRYAHYVGFVAGYAVARTIMAKITYQQGYRDLKWEQEAREFAADPAVREQYGDIITIKDQVFPNSPASQ